MDITDGWLFQKALNDLDVDKLAFSLTESGPVFSRRSIAKRREKESNF